ncbi:uncharacterized protein BDR25DRAFT_311317 [Lindgomyces ingoldianus]|uniref:Uncharacterized protein n=1 Tax=Lindgomyces ingoldianus TaxID=673940 RepID=A0ACB6R6J6_9PLEO|nr:uncharacterized protein BDR25DRAFT_311317 [Lindgomyces ingoldianus]KAF2474919.1 hypothetical protein BDR25DRAFT_311317 [Lindgomyces ingoldianus]
MKLATILASAPFIAHQVLASLNCTVVAPTLTQKFCEWDGCQSYATATAGQIVHAGCRADCSTEQEPWLQLYDGSFIRATNETLKGCRYHCKPYAITGLPYCFQERANFTGIAPAASVCTVSSTSGLASQVPAPKTLGIEPPAFPSISTLCSLGMTAPMPPATPKPVARKWDA